MSMAGPSREARHKGTLSRGVPSPPLGSPRPWVLDGTRDAMSAHGPSQQTDNREHCSENTHFKGNFPSDINSSQGFHWRGNFGFSSSNIDVLLNDLSLDSWIHSVRMTCVYTFCRCLFIQHQTRVAMTTSNMGHHGLLFFWLKRAGVHHLCFL